MELAHGPPHSYLPNGTFPSLFLHPDTGDTESPWGQGGTPVSPRSDKSRGSQVKLDGLLLNPPLGAINSSFLGDPQPHAALPHLLSTPAQAAPCPLQIIVSLLIAVSEEQVSSFR